MYIVTCEFLALSYSYLRVIRVKKLTVVCGMKTVKSYESNHMTIKPHFKAQVALALLTISLYDSLILNAHSYLVSYVS